MSALFHSMIANLRVRLRQRGRTSMSRAMRLTGAAVAAFVVAQVLFPETVPILAPLTALLVVEITLKDIVTSGVQRVASVTAGVLLAVAFSSIVGLSWWSLGALLAVSILVGQILRLGPHALEVPISAMLVLAAAGAEAAAVDRISETLIGAAVGVAVNLLFPPAVQSDSAAEAVHRFASQLAGLLRTSAAELRDPITQEQAERWMDEARALSRNVPKIDNEVDQAADSRRLNPRALVVPDISNTLRADLDALEHTTVAVRSMFRSIRDGVRYNPTVDPSRGEALRRAVRRSAAGPGSDHRGVRRSGEGRGHRHIVETQQEVAAALAALSEAHDRIDDLQLIDIGSEENGWELSEPVLEAVERVLRDLDINERGRRRQAARLAMRVDPFEMVKTAHQLFHAAHRPAGHERTAPNRAPERAPSERPAGSDWRGPDCPGPDRPGPDRPGPDRPGPDRPGPDRRENADQTGPHLLPVSSRRPPARRPTAVDIRQVAGRRPAVRQADRRTRPPAVTRPDEDLRP